MGMDYSYAGSASYSRFDEELCAIAEVLGGVLTEQTKFVFPEGTNETIVKWFNNIYGDDFTVEETKTIWEYISKHPEIDEISHQIWYELKTCVELNDAWCIY